MIKHHSNKEQTLVWADSIKLEYAGEILTQEQPEFFRNLQSFADSSMKLSTDLDSIHSKLSSDYGLNLCFLCCFSYTDGQSFSQYNPLQNVHF